MINYFLSLKLIIIQKFYMTIVDIHYLYILKNFKYSY